MNPLLDAGRTFIDPVRFAADPEIMREYPMLPYLTLRIVTMATDYFQTDYCLSVFKPNHRAFYKRIFNSSHWSSRGISRNTIAISNCMHPQGCRSAEHL